MQGQLFTQDFLREGIKTTLVWEKLSDEQLDAFITKLREIYTPFRADSKLNEATTDQEIILKVLAVLLWEGLSLPQNTTSGARREDVPDHLLFSDDKSKAVALKEKRDDRRYRHGILILEAKRWMRALDRGDATDKLDPGTPSNQILRYLSAAEIASERRIRWGILTNGRYWRLYWQGARSRSEEFLEIDVAALIGVKGVTADLEEGLDPRHGLKLFHCLFHRGAFLPQSWDTERRSFHDYALAEARHYEEKVSQNLGERVFGFVFPDLANALAAHDPLAPKPRTRAYLDEVRDSALILLYRLLFVLYAEDRLLLPVRDPRYKEYSLRKLRDEVREKRDAGAVFSRTATRLWDDLKSLFTSIAAGDAGIGLPAYNGGLFESVRTPILDRARVPDERMALILDELSRRVENIARYWINYRDLSVQHLGSIYERLLEFRLEEESGKLVARPTSFARKTTGSFYTHDDLVKLIIEETVGPLVREKTTTFETFFAKWKSRRELRPADWDALDAADPAAAILELRVCDPAMGSGHFLVSLVDYLADRVLESVSLATETVAGQRWAKDIPNPWTSPLVSRIADIRNRILASAAEHSWSVDAAQLDDRHIVRRMILKRVIHGVDKNPMAVELAKVALWLHTFTVGAPLSFLDHHLRCGDALHGERVESVAAELHDIGRVLQQAELARIEVATQAMEEIAELTDVDIAEAQRSKQLLEGIDTGLAALNALLDLWRALRWLIPGWSAKKFKQKSFSEHPLAAALVELFSGRYDLMRVVVQGVIESNDLFGDKPHQFPAQAEASRLIQKAKAVAAREHFLHWPTAFPIVWSHFDPVRRGFDAVIGNPPWDLLQVQEVEWFAERKPEIARAVRAADRKKMIAALEKKGDPLWADYVIARDTVEAAANVVRECGDYPMLAEGRSNLAKLFVERASALILPTGVVGFLVPSGVTADRGASEFFKSISTTGRLGALFDFENKKIFFPDIHASFKFCTLVFGGAGRQFKQSRCAFYLHDVAELADADRLLSLSAADFGAVNPNTGGTPIFRTKRDAAITTAIYRRQPVFVDRRFDSPKKIWPVKYMQGLFNMTSDSHLFKRKDELQNTGWYPIEHHRYRKGQMVALPLYVGRMIYTFDHRSAHVTVDSKNVHNAAMSSLLTSAEKQRPDVYPTPQYWVAESDVPEKERRTWCIGFRDIARATDMRTMIAVVIPTVAAGNTLPLIIPSEDDDAGYARFAPLLLANLNSLAFDYVARQKVQSTHLNWYIVEQLPLIRSEQFEAKLEKTKIADFIRGEVLRLSYTAHDLAPFARDLGYDGLPFKWDEDDRRHRMARLDALFFNLYGISREDAAYILDTFPIVREQDEKAHGRFLTKDLILAYMNAVAAGDLQTVVRL